MAAQSVEIRDSFVRKLRQGASATMDLHCAGDYALNALHQVGFCWAMGGSGRAGCAVAGDVRRALRSGRGPVATAETGSRRQGRREGRHDPKQVAEHGQRKHDGGTQTDLLDAGSFNRVIG